jgi:hypothetical protein
MNLKKNITFILIVLGLNFSFSQEKKSPLWVGPLKNKQVSGINFTPLVYDLNYQAKVNGLNIELVGIPLFLFMLPQDPVLEHDSLFASNDFDVNGVTISPLGLIQEGTVNGISITPWFSYIESVNGVHLSIFNSFIMKQNGLNVSLTGSSIRQMNGVQIGLFNRCKELRGIQIGLWNVNQKRKLPLINWSFNATTP